MGAQVILLDKYMECASILLKKFLRIGADLFTIKHFYQSLHKASFIFCVQVDNPLNNKRFLCEDDVVLS